MRQLVRYVAAVLLAAIATTSVIAAAAPQVWSVITAHRFTASLPDLNSLAERSVMFDVTGTQMQVFTASENRKPVTLKEVPQGVIDAVLAVEDEGFYRHHGVNLKSIMRAALANVSAGSTVQGGSTITQQVVKLGLVGSKRDGTRKIKEAMYALRLERTLTKDQILERYLNTVYFGNGAYGVKAAAETYFGKEVGALTMVDGAFLAGLIRDPGGYDPFRHPQQFSARRQSALDRLVKVGKMTKAQADEAGNAAVPIMPFITPERQSTPTYFVARARQQLLTDPVFLGDTDQERYNALFKGGLKIFTTFDPRLQLSAETARDSLPATDGQTEVAIASLDPQTGSVKALVGGPGFDRFQDDLSTKEFAQAGSAFKTFVLVAALEGGARPDDLIDGRPGCTFDIPNQAPYAPSGHGAGVGKLADMFSASVNCAFVRLGLIVTPQRVVDTAERMGIPKGIVKPFPSIALGTAFEGDPKTGRGTGVSPLSMASAYGTLAADGVRHEPYYVERIEDQKGHVIYQHQARGTQVIDPQVARTAVQIMKTVVTDGTGKKAAVDRREVAGKTGTTDNNANIWFVGYTPQLSTAVRIGGRFEQTKPVTIGGKVQFGGDLPAKIWQTYTSAALAGVPPTPFAVPAPFAPRPVMRLFLPGNECWAQGSVAPLLDPNASTTIPPLEFSPDPPPSVSPPTLDPHRSPITMVPVEGYEVQRCKDVEAAKAAAANTTTSAAPTPTAASTTTRAATTSSGP